MPRGGPAPGLSGGARPVAAAIVVALSRMNRILEVDLENGWARVEPGVINLDVTEGGGRGGLLLRARSPPRQQVCSIGGNVAENSGGAHCLKYGFTTNHVLGAARRARRRLAWSTWAGRPRHPRLRSPRRARGQRGDAGHRDRGHPAPPAQPRGDPHLLRHLPLHRRGRRRRLGDHRGRHPARGHRDDGPPRHRGRQGRPPGSTGRTSARRSSWTPTGRRRGRAHVAERRSRSPAPPARSRSGVRATRPSEQLMWKGRKSAFAAVGRISPNYMVEDGVIPRSEIAEVLREIDGRSREAGLRVANVFHAGDGNLHPLVLYDARVRAGGARRGPRRRDPAAVHPLRRLDHGRARRGRREGGLHGRDVHGRRSRHHAARPLRLRPGAGFNPGKVFPTPRLCGERPGPYRRIRPSWPARRSAVSAAPAPRRRGRRRPGRRAPRPSSSRHRRGGGRGVAARPATGKRRRLRRRRHRPRAGRAAGAARRRPPHRPPGRVLEHAPPTRS